MDFPKVLRYGRAHMAEKNHHDLTTKFQDELDTSDWNALAPHHARGALVIVAQDLDLVGTAVKIACDDTEQVKQWLQSSLLTKPTESQIQTWTLQPEKPFRFLIVQPYVLVQELAN